MARMGRSKRLGCMGVWAAADAWAAWAAAGAWASWAAWAAASAWAAWVHGPQQTHGLHGPHGPQRVHGQHGLQRMLSHDALLAFPDTNLPPQIYHHCEEHRNKRRTLAPAHAIPSQPPPFSHTHVHTRPSPPPPQGHFSAVTSLSLSTDGWLLLSGGRDKVVNVWDLRKNARAATVPVFEAVEGMVAIPAGAPLPGVPSAAAAAAAAAAAKGKAPP
eukprot:356470-Chlamydomonas_euryale.AAC.1